TDSDLAALHQPECHAEPMPEYVAAPYRRRAREGDAPCVVCPPHPEGTLRRHGHFVNGQLCTHLVAPFLDDGTGRRSAVTQRWCIALTRDVVTGRGDWFKTQ